MNDEERTRQDALISFILDGSLIKGTLINCSLWYASYLHTQVRHRWTQITIVFEDLDKESLQPKDGELVVIFDWLLMMARLLKTQPNLTLVDLVDEMDNANMLRQQEDEERAAPNQLAFAAVGWLSKYIYLQWQSVAWVCGSDRLKPCYMKRPFIQKLVALK